MSSQSDDQPVSVKGKFQLLGWVAQASSGLTKNETRVLLALALRAGAEPPWTCWPTQGTLAADIGEPDPMGSGRDKVSIAIRGLKKKRLITVEPRAGAGSLRYLIRAASVETHVPPSVESHVPPSVETHVPLPEKSRTPSVESHVPIRGNPRTEQIKNREEEQINEQPEQAEAFDLEPLKGPDQVQELFDLWREATGKKRARLDKARRKVLAQALKDHGFEACARAIRNVAHDAFAMGDNDRGKPFNEPRHIFDKAERFEHFRDLEPEAKLNASGKNVDELYAEWMEVYIRGMQIIDNTEEVDGFLEVRGRKIPVTGDIDLDRSVIALTTVELIAPKLHEERPDLDWVTEMELENKRATVEENRKRQERRRERDDRRADESGGRPGAPAREGAEAGEGAGRPAHPG